VIVLSLLSDERLARLAAGGDSLAFTTIYQRYHGQLYRYCRSIVGSPEDAADALQNTMLSAFRSLQGEIRSIRMKPWLYKIAHNESISVLRQRRPVAALEAASGVVGSDMALDSATRERLRELMADVGRLSERQRGALLMRELNGLDYQEIGAALGTSAGAAKQSVHEARVALVDVQGGRDMECESVRTLVSERDGRQLRGRQVRAHLETCSSCSGFRSSIVTRRRDLAAFVPVVPATTAAAALKAAMGGAAAGEAGGIATFLGGSSMAGAAGAAKTAAVVAVAASMGVGTFAYVSKDAGTNRDGAGHPAGPSGFVAPPEPPVAHKHHSGPRVAEVKTPPEPPAPKPEKSKKELRRERIQFVAQVPNEPPPLRKAPKPDEHQDKAQEEVVKEDSANAGRSDQEKSSGQGGKANHHQSGSGGADDQVDVADSGQDDQSGLPKNLDDLLAGDLADLIDRYSNAYLAGNFSSSDFNQLINRYTATVKQYTGARLAQQITSSLDASGITAMLEKVTGGTRSSASTGTTSATSSSQIQDLVQRFIPNMSSFLP
jgi:RNA polymerase sigma factor (sigma-70 family)